MSDDDLLASAFRKILTTHHRRYSYLFITAEDHWGVSHITFDDSYRADAVDGLTEEEFDAIRRAAEEQG